MDNLLLHEFLDNPNIQNEENVVLLGDYSSSSSANSISSFEFVWKSHPRLNSAAYKKDERGTKYIFCFAEYDKRDHSLRQLARFAVWVDTQNYSSALPFSLPLSSSPSAKSQPPAFLPKLNTGSDRLESLPELVESPLSPPPRDYTTSPLDFGTSTLAAPKPQYSAVHYANDISRSATRSASPSVSKPLPPQPYPSSPDSCEHFTFTEGKSSRRGSSDVPLETTSTLINTTSSHSAETDAAPSEGQPKANVPGTASAGVNNNTTPANSHHHTQVVSSLLLPDENAHPTESNVPVPMETAREKRPLIIPRPKDDTIQQPEDGPMFRAQISDYERKTSLLKAKVKKLLKRAMLVHERQVSLIEAHTLFLESIQDSANSEILSFQSLIQYYFNNKNNSAYFNIDLLRRSATKLNEHVIEPARRLYDQEIKSFDQRKRDFDDESREYYAWLSRYLSVKQEAKGKKKSDSDSKYIEKRRAFELRRFDYYTYLQDLHGGRKQQMVTHHLALFAESEINALVTISDRIKTNNKPAIDHIASEVKSASREWQRHREEREDQRRAIERSSKDSSATAPVVVGSSSLYPSATISADFAPSPLVESFSTHYGTLQSAGSTTGQNSKPSQPAPINTSSAPPAVSTSNNTQTSPSSKPSANTLASSPVQQVAVSPEISSAGTFQSSEAATTARTSASVSETGLPTLTHANSASSINSASKALVASPDSTSAADSASNSISNIVSPPLPSFSAASSAGYDSSRLTTVTPPPLSTGYHAISSPERSVLSPVSNPYETENSTSTTLPISGSNNNSAALSSSSTNTVIGGPASKQGLLWAMSRPGGINDQINLNKPGWHKFWVVLGAGKLCEYTNWKQGVVDLHNDPINLKMALVREARNAERRFCFEVVTPNYKRVYQATSEEDMQSWIRAINNGISSSLEDATKEFGKSATNSGLEGTAHAGSTSGTQAASSWTSTHHDASSGHSHTHHHGYSSSLSHVKSALDDKREFGDLRGELAKLNPRKVSLHRRTSKGPNTSLNTSINHDKQAQAQPQLPPLPSHSTTSSTPRAAPEPHPIPSTSNGASSTTPATASSISGSRIVDLVRNLDTSNHYCADCGQQSKVEWISINLLVVLCIDCSGVHRSLGTHISKVRSLTLDTVSFTPDFVELVKHVNNGLVNSIWEAKLPKPKNPAKIIEHRMSFIREKYIEKRYVNVLGKPNAVLRTAVQSRNVADILAALASRANTNTPMDSDDNGEAESPVLYSLRTAAPGATTFPIAELLVLNSAEVSSTPVSLASLGKLSSAAILYLKSKGGNIPTLAQAPATPATQQHHQLPLINTALANTAAGSAPSTPATAGAKPGGPYTPTTSGFHSHHHASHSTTSAAGLSQASSSTTYHSVSTSSPIPIPKAATPATTIYHVTNGLPATAPAAVSASPSASSASSAPTGGLSIIERKPVAHAPSPAALAAAAGTAAPLSSSAPHHDSPVARKRVSLGHAPPHPAPH